MKPVATPPPACDTSNWKQQPLEWPRAVGQVDALMAALTARQRRQRRRRVALASAACVAVLACAMLFSGRTTPFSTSPVTASTSVVTAPERRTLPDGSVVELKAGAELTVNFTATSAGPRDVVLTRGEAHFQVAKNPARPFVVRTGEGIAFRAVGTAFSVGVLGATLEMVVTEGRVAVDTPSASNADALIVPAGHVVTVGRTASPPEIAPLSAAESEHRLAWRVPRLEFNETPLWEVVSLLNQHSGSRISLASSELGRVEISGALRADNLEPLLRILETQYQIEVVRGRDHEIMLRPAR